VFTSRRLLARLMVTIVIWVVLVALASLVGLMD